MQNPGIASPGKGRLCHHAPVCQAGKPPTGLTNAAPAGSYLQTRKGTHGAVAQLGERLNGIQEADGSIPFSSTTTSLFVSVT